MRLLSRNAEALFWLARYLERGASLARVIEMQSSYGAPDQGNGWAWLLALHADEDRFRERFEVSSSNIIAFYVTDTGNVGSIRSSINWARENARALRPFIPLEMWAQLNAFHAAVSALDHDDIRPSQLPRTCEEIQTGCLSQIGIADGTLYRDEGYQFFKLGLLIERADQTSRLLDVKFAQSLLPSSAPASPQRGAPPPRSVDPSDDFVFWSTILRTAAGFQVFQRLEPGGTTPDRVARFLVLNPSHPRSIGFCVREIGDALQILRGSFRLTKASKCLEACELLMDGLQAAARDAALAGRLHEFNDWVQRSLYGLTDAIGSAFFKIEPPAPKLPPEPPTPVPPTLKQRQKQTSGGSTQAQEQS